MMNWAGFAGPYNMLGSVPAAYLNMEHHCVAYLHFYMDFFLTSTVTEVAPGFDVWTMRATFFSFSSSNTSTLSLPALISRE